MSFRHSHDTQDIVMMNYCTKGFLLVYEHYTKLIATHESIVTKPKYTSLLCTYGLWPVLRCLS